MVIHNTGYIFDFDSIKASYVLIIIYEVAFEIIN